jgi:hypothetical protein
VVWTSLVNATVSGRTLFKTGGCDGCQDSGAVSQQQLVSGNANLDFPVSSPNLVRYIGLNHSNTGTSAGEIPFAIKLVSGYAEVREHGQYRADVPVSTGDVLRIAVRSGGIVRYMKNGAVFYTSGSTVTYPLRVDTALLSTGANFTNVRVFGFTSGGGGMPAAPALTLTPTQTKNFHFSWADVSGESEYRLLENPDGSSGYTPIATLAANSNSHDLEVFLPGRINARYILQACNSAGCADSAPVMVTGTLAEAVGYMKASQAVNNQWFGYAVDLSRDGNTLAVGAYKVNAKGVYIYIRNATGWTQQTYLGGDFGNAVALSDDGNTLAIGAEDDAGIAVRSGAVFVYVRSGGNWTRQAYVKASNLGENDLFGHSVALSGDGNTLAAGAHLEDSRPGGDPGNPGPSDDSGAAYVFSRNAGVWTQQAFVKAPFVPDSNSQWEDHFGWSLALSANGDTLAVGAIHDITQGGGGAGYIYTRGAGTWSYQTSVSVPDTREFGYSIALSDDGNTLAVGEGFTEGGAHVFVRSADTWTRQASLQASNLESHDRFGYAVALSGDGNILAVGAYEEDSAVTGINGDKTDNSSRESGAVYVYTRSSGVWGGEVYVKAPDTAPATFDPALEEVISDAFGWSVALSGDGATLAVGAILEDSLATGVNGDQN